MSFAQDIERVAGDEPIEGIVIGKEPWLWADDGDRGRVSVATDKQNVLLTWAAARPMLDYDYDSGFGGKDCHAIYAWTANWVIFVRCYDGATSVSAVPRHPVASPSPRMYGGG